MNLLQRLVIRGNAIMREWYGQTGIDEGSQRMIAELSATTLVNLCGKDIKNWSYEEQKDKANMVRIALTSAYQIGSTVRNHNKCKITEGGE